MTLTDLPFHQVSRLEAVDHALREARGCIRGGFLCAAVAMLRKVLDLWSQEMRDRHGYAFTKQEPDKLYWRLKKFSAANPAYESSVSSIMDSLRIDANDALHDSTACYSSSMGPVIYGQKLKPLLDSIQNLVETTWPVVLDRGVK